MSSSPSPTSPSGGTARVPDHLGGHPVDAIVRELFGVSWGKARDWVRGGKVSADGRVVTEATRKLRTGMEVVVNLAAPRPRPGPRLARDAVHHLDAHVIVAVKPSGISSVPYRGTGDAGPEVAPEEATMDELVREYLEKTSAPRQGRSVGPVALGVVHRIDKETSGLLVFTRTWLAKQSLAAQFRAHTVHRRYLALVHGHLRAATYESHIVPDRGDGLRGSIEAMPARKGRGVEGQWAVTHVEPLEYLEGATLVACRLETGRTHQIRIHLSEAGHPLVGERVYIRGYGRRPGQAPEIPASRLMLHAAELGFLHPATEEPVRWEQPPPADFEETLERLRTASSTAKADPPPRPQPTSAPFPPPRAAAAKDPTGQPPNKQASKGQAPNKQASRGPGSKGKFPKGQASKGPTSGNPRKR